MGRELHPRARVFTEPASNQSRVEINNASTTYVRRLVSTIMPVRRYQPGRMVAQAEFGTHSDDAMSVPSARKLVKRVGLT